MANTKIFWLHALSPLHVGAGRGVGYIDLPIMREKVTNWPLVPGSAVKGVARDYHHDRKTKPEWMDFAFGKGGDDHSNSGSLVFTDARLVCLPIRSLYGTFAWTTSPMLLARLARDLRETDDGSIPDLPPRNENAHLPLSGTHLTDAGNDVNKVYLEDLDLDVAKCAVAEKWADLIAKSLFADGVDLFKKRFAVLPDDVFNFLCETGTEVAARVKIQHETKTVQSGALWYEEALPAETILAGLVWCDRVFGGESIERDDLLKTFCTGETNLQIGGKATVGRGRVRCLFRA